MRLKTPGKSPAPPAAPAAAPENGAAADDLDGHLQDRISRLDTAMGGAAAGYAEARTEMQGHHQTMDQEVRKIRKELVLLRPQVEAFLYGKENEGLTDAVAAKCRRYLELNARLGQCLLARRTDFGATLPPGEQELGAPIDGREHEAAADAPSSPVARAAPLR